MEKPKEWLSIGEALALYNPEGNLEAFRRDYCAPGGILQGLGGLRSLIGGAKKGKGKTTRRTLRISRTVILALIEQEKARVA
jgi:hypothetical protein